MRSFWGFKRHAVIVVNEDEEQARSLKLQESQTGKDLPESAVLEMKANMSVPRVGEWLEKVTFASLAETEAKAQVQKYNSQGRDAGFGNMQHRRDFRYDYNNRWGHGGPRRDIVGVISVIIDHITIADMLTGATAKVVVEEEVVLGDLAEVVEVHGVCATTDGTTGGRENGEITEEE